MSKLPKKIAWAGPIPKCDICGKKESGKFDCPTIFGQWANMCPNCLGSNGTNIGIGTEKVPASEVPDRKKELADAIVAGDLSILEDLIEEFDTDDWMDLI